MENSLFFLVQQRRGGLSPLVLSLHFRGGGGSTPSLCHSFLTQRARRTPSLSGHKVCYWNSFPLFWIGEEGLFLLVLMSTFQLCEEGQTLSFFDSVEMCAALAQFPWHGNKLHYIQYLNRIWILHNPSFFLASQQPYPDSSCKSQQIFRWSHDQRGAVNTVSHHHNLRTISSALQAINDGTWPALQAINNGCIQVGPHSQSKFERQAKRGVCRTTSSS